MQLVANSMPAGGDALDHVQARLLGSAAPAEVYRYLRECPRYQPTPLVRLQGLASQLGVAEIAYKDEGQRLGLKSFKALGGAYAVGKLVERHVQHRLGRELAPAEMVSDEVRRLADELTVCCATDGNHGRSVAAGARLFGCRCMIYCHTGVSQSRVDAIASFGAEVVRCEGGYEGSLEAADTAGKQDNWIVVSDTSLHGDAEIPGWVMQGYTVIADEALDQMDQPPTHVFLQGGVGGLAAAVSAHLCEATAGPRPQVVVVEPEGYNCLLESARTGEPVYVPEAGPTTYAMLECRVPSPAAFNVLAKTASFFMDLPDHTAAPAMTLLARSPYGDPVVVAGESGCAGLAGLLAICDNPEWQSALSLNADSRILLVGSEGATDPQRYAELVGLDPAELA